MSGIKDTRFINDNAVRDEDILLDNNQWLRGRNAANSADINVLKVDASNRVHISDSANALPVVMGAQLASDPTGVAGGFYYNTTTNVFRFYNGTTWADLGGGASTTLSNLTNTIAIPDGVHILPLTTLQVNLGAALKKFNDGYIQRLYSANLTQAASGNAQFNITTVASTSTGTIDIRSGNSSAGASGNIAITTGTATGGTRGLISLNGLSIDAQAQITAILGTQSAPSYSFSSDTNTGMFLVGNDEIGFTTNGERRLRIDSIGNILPNGNNSGSLGTTSVRWSTAVINTIRVGNSTVNGETSIIDALPNVPSGGNIIGMRLNHSTSNTSYDFGMITSNATDHNTRSIRFETGNATGASNSSGNFVLRSGVISGTGTRGHVDLQDTRALILPKLAAAPSSPVAGMMYYDTATDKSYTYDGTTWQAHW